MRDLIFLPYLIPLGKDIEHKGIAFRMLRFSDCEEESNQITFSLNEVGCALEQRYGINYKDRGIDFDSAKWVFLEFKNPQKPKESYLALLDIVIDRWKEVLEKPKRKTIALVLNDRRDFPKVYKLTRKFINRFKKGVDFVDTNRRISMGLSRWFSSYKRQDSLDVILDCCASLEAIFNLDQELRLRLSLYVEHFLDIKKGNIASTVYEMYGFRNDIIHGTKAPIIKDSSQYIKLVLLVLKKILELNKMPDNVILDRKIGIIK